MPLTREKRLVASLFEDRRQGPFRFRQSTRLALEGNGGHAAAVRNAAGLDGCPTRCATRLSIEGKKRHALGRKTIKIRCRHAAVRSAAVHAGIPVTKVIG